MACNYPLKGWVKKGGGFTSSRSLSPTKVKMTIPCGQCTGCRLDKARQWAIRCIHEAQTSKESSFVTLTYDDDHLPPGGNLEYEDFQLFMKRLRKRYCRKKVRFYMCGEYGDQYGRPHYHALLFGADFHDKTIWRTSKGNNVYRSETLEDLWDLGNSEIGDVTYQSASYVAAYIHKKQTGKKIEDETPDSNPDAFWLEPETGELVRKREPFTQMSLKPGIGYEWYQKYKSDLWPEDRVVLPDGKTAPVPKYYRKLLEAEDPELFNKIRRERIEKSKSNPDNTYERREVKERSAKLKLNRKTRNLND